MESLQLSELKVTVIGLGNLAWNLIPNLQTIGEVHQVIGRSNVKECQDAYQVPYASESLEDLHPESNLVFLTVGDQAIPSVAKALADQERYDCVFVHCSGSTPLSSLDVLGEQIGVIYPLQTFTRQRVRSFQEVPLFLEGVASVLKLLHPIATALSEKVYELNSTTRQRLHMGGVLSCNFTNLLYRLSEKLIQEQSDLDFQVFEPLVRGHIENVFSLGPGLSQTGPAIRRDERTLQLHRELLDSHHDIQHLYQMMTQLIQEAFPTRQT